MILDQTLFLARPKTSQHQDALTDSRFSEFDPFVRASYPEPFRPSLLQRLRNGHSAKAIGVRFDDSQDHALPTDVLADHPEVVQDRLKRNLRPDWPPSDMDRFRHRLLECQTPPRRRDHNSYRPIRPRRVSKQLAQHYCRLRAIKAHAGATAEN